MGSQHSFCSSLRTSTSFKTPIRTATQADLIGRPSTKRVIAYGPTHSIAFDRLKLLCQSKQYPEIQSVPCNHQHKIKNKKHTSLASLDSLDLERNLWYCGYATNPHTIKLSWLYNTVFFGKEKNGEQKCVWLYWNSMIFGCDSFHHSIET